MINQNLLLAGDDAYNLTKSLRFRKSASAYLSRTPASASNRKTWTLSSWVKKAVIDGDYPAIFNAGTSAPDTVIRFNAGDTLSFTLENGGGSNYGLTTTAVYRDPSAWYHVLSVCDTTQATSSDRMKLYINGVQVTAFGTANYPSQNFDTNVNNTVAHKIGAQRYAAGYLDGYLTEVNFIDGQALTPSSFGETDVLTGVWKPKKYAGTYGTNGFYLPFTDVATTSGSNAGLGKDFSGNGNYWNTNNISVTAGTTYDSMNDVPTLTSATASNYCVLSPIDTYDNSPTDGNLKRVGVGHTGSPFSTCRGTIGVSSGKWYFEALNTGTVGSSGNNMIGVMTTTSSDLTAFGGSTNRSYQDNGGLQGDSSTGTVSSSANGDIIMVAFDVDAGKMWVGKNGTWMNSGAPASGTGNVFTTLPTSPITPQISMYGNTGDTKGWVLNFGQQGFTYTPPTGFVALNTFNLPEPSIKAGNKHFNATTYTGTGSNTTITNAGSMQPDFVWIKYRNSAVTNCLIDSVRGATKYLFSDATSAEATVTDALTSFNSNGFTLSTNSAVNANGGSFVGWQWQAGQGSTSSNTAGSITSTVSANPTAGFSVVTYTGNGSGGATVGHGLGVAPKMIIVKRRDGGVGATNWPVYNAYLNNGVNPAQYHLFLNLTNAQGGATVLWNDTAPTSSVFSLGTYSETNGSGGTFVAYCFAPVAGYSAMGSYTGNGSTDGAFVHLGFRPKFVMWKRTNTTGDWNIIDTSRDTYNFGDKELFPNLSDAETVIGGGLSRLDLLSNGFKVRGADSYQNASGSTYIYMAFAENPAKYALAR